MPKVSITKLFEDNAKSLELGWVITPKSKKIILDSNEINHSTEGLIGNLNLTHPNWIQIFSKTEAHYFAEMTEEEQRQALEKLRNSGLFCLILSDDEIAPNSLSDFAMKLKIPTIRSPLGSQQIIWVIRTYLGKALADFEIQHGVLLATRQTTIKGQIDSHHTENLIFRLSHASSERILGVDIRKVQISVAAGRNLAVLVEAAVRNYILQLRGIDSTQEFVERQKNEINR